MYFHCDPQNDLYRVLTDAGYKVPRFDTLAETIAAAEPDSAIFSLSDTYPRQSGHIDAALLAAVDAKQLTLYIEYPAAVHGMELQPPARARWERAVVTSEAFEPDLSPGRILSMHGCWYLPVEAKAAPLSLAKVAGYNSAVFDLPETTYPLLTTLPGTAVWVATSALSRFVTGRYAPEAAWKSVWEHMIKHLTDGRHTPTLSWEPLVQVTPAEEQLPQDAEARAIRRSVKWFKEQGVYSIDAKKGVIEGFESLIDHDGRQMRRTWVRADCIAEAGMLFAHDWALHGDPSSKQLATEILDYVWGDDFYQNDPNSPMYGLSNWYERGPIFYGDDNARVLLATMVAAELLDDPRWDERVLTCLLANVRTTGTLGFRRDNLRQADFEKHGNDWRFFRNEAYVNYAPHFQCWLWACNMWGYALTGYEGFMDRTRTAMQMTMDKYPEWRWTNGLTQEMARMLLPLSFLLRLEDTPKHREWLQRMGEDLLQHMQPSGAIREAMGTLENGRYAAPCSNEAYGTREASLIQQNGDPACDLLYTTNFAFLGLREAAAVTGDPMFQEAEDKLAEFLVRIQVQSTELPFLNGAWMRSFDYELWEYWGSSADLGWGPWCVQSGWTATWITSVLAQRQLDTVLFNTDASARYKALLPRVLAALDME